MADYIPQGAQFYLPKSPSRRVPRYYKVDDDGRVLYYLGGAAAWVPSHLNERSLDFVMEFFTDNLKSVE